MRTLLEDGWERIVEGITTFEEVLKVAKGAELALEPERSAQGRTAAKDEAQQERAQVEA